MIADRDAEIARAVEHLIDVSTSHHTNRDDETFTECHLCGQWEDHATACPIPWLRQWQTEKPNPERTDPR